MRLHRRFSIMLTINLSTNTPVCPCVVNTGSLGTRSSVGGTVMIMFHYSCVTWAPCLKSPAVCLTLCSGLKTSPYRPFMRESSGDRLHSQRSSCAERVSISWRHHVMLCIGTRLALQGLRLIEMCSKKYLNYWRLCPWIIFPVMALYSQSISYLTCQYQQWLLPFGRTGMLSSWTISGHKVVLLNHSITIVCACVAVE